MLCKRRSIRRCLALLLMLALPLCAAQAQDMTLPSAGARDQTVRVYLSRLNLTDRMDLTLVSAYSVHTQAGAQLHFQAGSEVAVLLRDGALYLYYEGMSQLAGQSVTLLRDTAEGESGFRLTNYPALYAGDLQIDVVDGKVRPILSVHVEDYLLGVVPYEMSDSFPLEALKAQAVAARTYALRSQDPSQPYDLVDTTNDQVYRGYLPGNDQTERAIQETRGVCGFYRDQLAQCYYSASNGGQTELVETVWPTDEDFGYYAFGDDPYDVANPDSVVRSFEMKKTYGEEETAPYALRNLLATQLFDQLTAECRCFLNRNLTRFHNLACSVETTLFSQELYNFLFDGFVLFLRLSRLCGSCGIALVELFQLSFGVRNQFCINVGHRSDSDEEFTISHSIFLSCLSALALVATLFIYQRGSCPL